MFYTCQKHEKITSSLFTLTLSILTLSRMTLSKVSFSDILRNDYLDHFDTFGENFYFDTFKNDTFESVSVDRHPHIHRMKFTRLVKIQRQRNVAVVLLGYVESRNGYEKIK